jgi:hypothetical protein
MSLKSMWKFLFGKPDPVPPAPEVYTPPPSITWHRKGDRSGRFSYYASAVASDLVLAAPVVVRYEWTDTRRGWCAYTGADFVYASQTARGAMLGATPHAIGLLTRRGPDILDILAKNAVNCGTPPVPDAAAPVPEVKPAEQPKEGDAKIGVPAVLPGSPA